MISFSSLKNTSISTISNTMDLAFSDYSIPITFPVETLTQKFVTENIQLHLSVGAFDNKKLVGVILLGYNPKKQSVYNGGTGVIPDYRGQKLTQKMYTFSSSLLKDIEIKQQQLEVISNNLYALRNYKKIGFSITRKLNCYNGYIKPNLINTAVKIKVISNVNWPLLRSFWCTLPTWQNDIQAIEMATQPIEIMGAFLNSKLVGYLILSTEINRIHQVAVAKEYRRRFIASTLFKYVATNYSEKVTIINVDENAKATNIFLEKIGLINFLQQYEMKLST